MKYAEVYVGYPLDRPFTYRIPPGLEVRPFDRVRVNFRGRTVTGYVAETHDRVNASFDEGRIKDILEVADAEPIFDARLMEMARYTAETYLCSTGEGLAMALPSALRPSSRYKTPFAEMPAREFVLTEEQRSVHDAILAARDAGSLLHLVHGITGSGKTELYITLARRLMDQGLSVIYCVPEISLSSQIYERLHGVFGSALIVYHSGLTAQQRLHNWMKFYRGEASIAVGTRSAIFLQCPRLGMIVIDEEHDGSYKEHSTPRYNARRLALQRSRAESALLVLGSATPSVETLYAAERGVFTLHRLLNRYGGAALPEIEIAKIRGARNPAFLLSNTLKVSVKRALDKKEQVIFLLNRRGFAPIVLCESCGATETCPHCNISLNLHRDGKLLCHYCGHTRTLKTECTACGAKGLVNLGSGTQRMEDTVVGTFRNVKTFRLDQDSSRKKGTAFDLLEKMKGGDIDILLGTQMVAKGFDFPNVSVVGVLLADIGINMPDFRAAERVFSLLTQVSGRCGRGDKPGKVIVQAVNDEHPLFTYLKNHDYEGFYRSELEARRLLRYPPFSRIARLLVRGTSEEGVMETAGRLGDELRRLSRELDAPLDILGPSPAPLAKIANNHRWHIIIKSANLEGARDVVRRARDTVQGKDTYLEIDMDPFDMM
jgi:primosomal protein N' (replication factor Y)